MFAPLIKTPPPPTHTHIIRPCISAFVVGSQRIIITHDLDIYKFNTQWLTPTGYFAVLHDLDKTIAESGIDTCTIESGTYTSAALRGHYDDNIYIHGRH